MKLVVGLGNIGKRYAHTRHNIGFMMVDELLHQFKTAPDSHLNSQIYGLKVSDWKVEPKLQAEVASVELENDTFILAKPQTMMNLSGDAVGRLMQKYRLHPSDVWIIFDDLDTPFGRLRLRQGGSGGGHQGLRSLIETIGADFVRVKVGISLNDRAVEPSESYVLKPFNADEQAALPKIVEQTARELSRQLTLDAPTGTTFNFL